MRAIILLAIATIPVFAQLHYPKHYVSLGLGAALPRGQLSGLFQNKPDISVNYAYRFQRHLQVDGGLETVFGAAGVRDFLQSDFGYIRIRDFQWLFPFGGRVLLPTRSGRVMLSAGGGGAYMRYSERLRQPSSYYHFECPYCTSRGGWAAYAVVGVSLGLDHFQRFRTGVTTKFYRGRTSGGAIGALPAVETRDRWTNIFGDFTVTF